jgi:hypothetical protein
MEITEEIKTDVLDEKKQNDIFYTLLTGKTVKETVETSRGKFVVKFPKQKDFIAIDRRIAAMRGGLPAVSFDDVANFTMQKVAYLDVCVESGEDWFNNIRKENPNFSWGDMPDINFIDEVYVKAWTFRNKVQGNFGRNENEAVGADSDAEGVSETVGNGLFSGVAASNKRA